MTTPFDPSAFLAPAQSVDERARLLDSLCALESNPTAQEPEEFKPWRATRKPSPGKLFDYLYLAACQGQTRDVSELLAMGAALVDPAAPTGAKRWGPPGDAISGALERSQMESAALLMSALAERDPKAAQSETRLKEIAKRASASLMLSFCHAPWPSARAWLSMACSAGRLPLLEELCAVAGAPESIHLYHLGDAIARGFASAAHRKHSPAALSTQQLSIDAIERYAKLLLPETSALLYREAIRSDCAPALISLLKSGLKPSDNWTVTAMKAHPTPLPLFAFCSANRAQLSRGPSRDCLAILRAIPMLMESALAVGAPPGYLKELSWPQMLEISSMGFSLDAVNKQGENVAHLWARETASESLPLLKALCRERPELLLTANQQGKTALEVAYQMFPTGASQELRLCFVSNEKKQIKTETPISKKSGPKPRRASL